MPAQAAPLGATSRIPGLLEEKVKAGLTFVLEPFWAVAVSWMTVPSCMEALTLGFRVIFAGKGEVPGGLWPPHAGKNKNKEMETTTDDHWPNCNLLMHP